MQIQNTRLAGERAVVASRNAVEQPDSTEIERLATAAGYEIVATITQRRREDPGTWLGSGKAEEVADHAETTDADAVIVDGGLSPGQYANFIELLPPGVELVDRYRLVLDIFAEGAGDRRAALQVEAATLEYQLPRLRQVTEESLLNRATEKGSPVLDFERRIDRIEAKLDDLSAAARERREQRRHSGFGLVTIAGYTNAGKTTLLHRLADELAIDEHGSPHQDLTTTAPAADELFVTLETVTRRGAVAGIDVLYTDTVGLIDGLPHDLVESFSATLDEVAAGDVVLLVVDATDDPERISEKVTIAREAFDELRAELVVVLNKVDLVDDVAERQRAVQELSAHTVPVSALEGTGIDRLHEQIHEALPTERATFTVGNTAATQQFLSWAHEQGAVETRYENDVVHVTLEARPNRIEQARSRVEDISEQEGNI
ncbi:GTPase HflX [Halomicrobium sp. LC1Hm]|uniref:GTPase HflX n=1 Tax=Halomicrobium sp. LC1Hm TaxID=2610902 RepID=UPI001298492B|nr:GTPase HflX [Halomicrobium sp. LC1Hm]QGA81971.1 GTP-binding protein protease modulator [Halomicrobium sp. LC1Hm]